MCDRQSADELAEAEKIAEIYTRFWNVGIDFELALDSRDFNDGDALAIGKAMLNLWEDFKADELYGEVEDI